MNAPSGTITAEALDDITTFMGPLPPEEYELRRKIRVCRNCATHKATLTASADARTLLWMVATTATRWIYSPASVEELTEITTFLRRLLILADQAEKVEALS